MINSDALSVETSACCEPLPGSEKKASAGDEPCCAGNAGDAERGEQDAIRDQVRTYYATRALEGSTCCSPGCGCGLDGEARRISTSVGYTEEELRAAPDGANLGLGCGNPTAIDEIPEGATVLDLGSGAGIDCFLAAEKVGADGYVIGVDMTPEMIERARQNAARVGAANVEFRLGTIEDLPIPDASIDVVISNCVINLSPDKARAFREAHRVLKPEGKLMVSDLVLTRPLPTYIRESAEAYAGCIGGALLETEYLDLIRAAGFQHVVVVGADSYFDALGVDSVLSWLPEAHRTEGEAVLREGPPVVSLKVLARRSGSSSG